MTAKMIQRGPGITNTLRIIAALVFALPGNVVACF